ncbi:MAG: hypothetical protein N3D18_00895 [Roseococcus sp.]|nr:hypothetical protein [Roseococcus sp.]
MAALFESGRAADLVLAALLVEACALWALARFAGRGPGLAPLLPFLLAGAAFALALRAALTGAGWGSVALPLLAAFAAHLWDIVRRWR